MGCIGAAGAVAVASGMVRSDIATGNGLSPEQPVPFSHKHHVGGLGLDCRYCHTNVEVGPIAGMPPTETCMTCHSQLWTEASLLKPVRDSWRTREAIRWRRVNDLADFVYFDHHVHVSAGVGCNECHGSVDEMPLMRQGESLRMSFCLDCHRDPTPRLRPRDQVFNMNWKPPDDRRALGVELVRAYGVETGALTHCYVCHR